MAKYFKKDIDFNVDLKRESTDGRTYGFMKTLRSDTPIPMAHKKIGSSTLLNRLRTWHEVDFNNDESESESTGEQGSLASVESPDGRTNSLTPFQMKRKMFDTAEFTITRGQKLSDNIHPTHSGLKVNIKDMEIDYMEDLEAYCRKMNIKLDK